jgi:hypothetical protein
MDPYDWQVGDLRWVLTEAQTPGKEWTRYRCWQAMGCMSSNFGTGVQGPSE